VSPEARGTVIAHVNASPGVSLEGLIHSAAPVASVDDIYGLIASGDIYVDLHRTPLVEPATVSVFEIEQATLPLIALIESEGSQIPKSGAGRSDRTEELLREASENDLNVANERLRHVSSHLNKQLQEYESSIPLRTLPALSLVGKLPSVRRRKGYRGIQHQPRENARESDR
jgi:hypothetical protein